MPDVFFLLSHRYIPAFVYFGKISATFPRAMVFTPRLEFEIFFFWGWASGTRRGFFGSFWGEAETTTCFA